MNKKDSALDIRKNRCIRYSANEWEEISRRAERAGIAPGTYVRKISLRGSGLKTPRRKNPTAGREIKKLKLELARVGNNLNQLTRWANARLKSRESADMGLGELARKIDAALGDFQKTAERIDGVLED